MNSLINLNTSLNSANYLLEQLNANEHINRESLKSKVDENISKISDQICDIVNNYSSKIMNMDSAAMDEEELFDDFSHKYTTIIPTVITPVYKIMNYLDQHSIFDDEDNKDTMFDSRKNSKFKAMITNKLITTNKLIDALINNVLILNESILKDMLKNVFLNNMNFYTSSTDSSSAASIDDSVRFSNLLIPNNGINIFYYLNFVFNLNRRVYSKNFDIYLSNLKQKNLVVNADFLNFIENFNYNSMFIF